MPKVAAMTCPTREKALSISGAVVLASSASSLTAFFAGLNASVAFLPASSDERPNGSVSLVALLREEERLYPTFHTVESRLTRVLSS